MKEWEIQLTGQITLRVLLELCDPLIEILLLLLAVLQRSSLQLGVVSLYSRVKLATHFQNHKTFSFRRQASSSLVT